MHSTTMKTSVCLMYSSNPKHATIRQWRTQLQFNLWGMKRTIQTHQMYIRFICKQKTLSQSGYLNWSALAATEPWNSEGCTLRVNNLTFVDPCIIVQFLQKNPTRCNNTLPDNVQQLHLRKTFHIWKTRGCLRSFRLPMMGGVSPKTCWASFKYGIKFWYNVAPCWVFFFFCKKLITVFIHWRVQHVYLVQQNLLLFLATFCHN